MGPGHSDCPGGLTMYARLAWLLAALTAIGAVADTVVVGVSISLFSEESVGLHGWPMVNLATVGSSVLGALVISTYPRHPIGWLLALIGFTGAVSLLAESYSVWVLDHDGPGSRLMGEWSGMLAAALGGSLALAALTVVFLLVPDGRFLSKRWRYVAIASAAGYASFLIGVAAIGPHSLARRGDVSRNLVTDLLLSIGVLLIAVMLIAAVVAMMIRLRLSSGDARQQLKLVAFGAASIGFALVTLIVGESFSGDQTWWSSIPLYAAYVVLIGCIAVAVLRYRLYDIDVIISRAVVFTVATVFVAVGYVAIVVVVGLALGSKTPGFWPSVTATAVVALAFQPLRRRIVHFADRLAYGERAAPYDALASLSRRLGQSPSPDSLLPALAEASAQATRAELVRVELDVEAGQPRNARWPMAQTDAVEPEADPDLRIWVADRAGSFGRIELWMRAGISVREPERRLVQDLADHAAVAFRNARLEAELKAHVATLDRHNEELSASRRRIIEGSDSERRRLEASIARDILPTLADLASGLETAQTREVDEWRIPPMIDEATEALESLRDLTRGIYPTMLTRAGLGPALASYFARPEHRGELELDESARDRRFSTRVETAIYFCCTQAFVGDRSRPHVRLSVADGQAIVEITGVDVRPADRPAMVDRVEVCGGTIGFNADAAGCVLLRIPATDANRYEQPTELR
jgi:hypothetical protein